MLGEARDTDVMIAHLQTHLAHMPEEDARLVLAGSWLDSPTTVKKIRRRWRDICEILMGMH